MACSYPPDTFALTEQATIEDLDVKACCTAVATAFPAFQGKFGDAITGNPGVGDINFATYNTSNRFWTVGQWRKGGFVAGRMWVRTWE